MHVHLFHSLTLKYSEKEVNEKHSNCCYYDSAVHFEFESLKVNKIILFFRVKNRSTSTNMYFTMVLNPPVPMVLAYG